MLTPIQESDEQDLESGLLLKEASRRDDCYVNMYIVGMVLCILGLIAAVIAGFVLLS